MTKCAKCGIIRVEDGRSEILAVSSAPRGDKGVSPRVPEAQVSRALKGDKGVRRRRLAAYVSLAPRGDKGVSPRVPETHVYSALGETRASAPAREGPNGFLSSYTSLHSSFGSGGMGVV